MIMIVTESLKLKSECTVYGGERLQPFHKAGAPLELLSHYEVLWPVLSHLPLEGIFDMLLIT
jgi:hypothetical protein